MFRFFRWFNEYALHQKLYGGLEDLKKPTTSSLLLDWSCKRTRRRSMLFDCILILTKRLSLYQFIIVKLWNKKICVNYFRIHSCIQFVLSIKHKVPRSRKQWELPNGLKLTTNQLRVRWATQYATPAQTGSLNFQGAAANKKLFS